MDKDYIIDKLVISFMKIKFISEKTELINASPNDTKIIQLDDIINNLKTTETIIDDIKNPNHFNEIEKLVYSKKWHNLQPFHRTAKIKEYFNDLPIDAKLKAQLLLDMEKLMNDKKIKINKHLVYDSNQQKITSMPMLKINEKQQYYLNTK